MTAPDIDFRAAREWAQHYATHWAGPTTVGNLARAHLAMAELIREMAVAAVLGDYFADSEDQTLLSDLLTRARAMEG